ncbi:MAG TPA: hypothetical protein VF092_04980 [Longimicrobium sp.]
MNKLSLNVEELDVETFATARGDGFRGTVDARGVSTGTNTCYCTSRNIGCWCTEQC